MTLWSSAWVGDDGRRLGSWRRKALPNRSLVLMKGNAPLLLALALLATGCGPLLSVRPACERNPALVAAVDWSTVDLVEIHITRKGFEPHQVELRRNQPAILRVANADDRPHVFNAPKFFPAAALGNIRVDDQPIAELCPDAIDILPNSILDIAVIPLQSGRFPFGGPDIPVKSWGSGIAVMYVEGNREVVRVDRTWSCSLPGVVRRIHLQQERGTARCPSLSRIR